jgi:hypothetical protein
MRAANTLQSSGLIELNDTEYLGVTDHRKGQPQQYQGRKNAIGEELSKWLQGWLSRSYLAFPSVTQGCRKPSDALASRSDKLDAEDASSVFGSNLLYCRVLASLVNFTASRGGSRRPQPCRR